MGIRNKLKLLIGIFFAICWIINGLFLNAFQFINYISVRPFSIHLYRKINYYLIYSSWSQTVALSEWWAKNKLTIYFADQESHDHFGKEHALAVMNHKYEIDWLYTWTLSDKFHCLGSGKCFAKKSLKWIPVVGWGWIFCEMIFLERAWSKDSLILAQSLDRLLEYWDHILLLLFAEGTRFTPEKYEASLKFAEEKDLPRLKHHLLPRPRGFVFTINHVKNKMPAIYNVQLTFKESSPSPTLTSVLKGNSVHGYFYVERIPMSDIPTSSEDDIAKFLYDLYKKKDNLMDYFQENGKFPGIEVVIPRRKSPLLNSIAWFAVVISMFCYFMFNLVSSKNYVLLGVFITGFVVALLFVLVIIRSTKAKKGSSYGKGKGVSNKSNKNANASGNAPSGPAEQRITNGALSTSTEHLMNSNNAHETKKDI
ncbi:1-acyl-sn-glycerol-3-phosphate acyltransferase delta-like protein [Dinothrombium tinctorium]|uniref:1-acyl-sn-glycerol-3-phosphate acyltransferase delta-like protein n=1 Tax=Dinothrombium tinctorium TaxID=1965070 RepID=A0A3S3SK58_9ACAR|nr:1-acyl-sn-glycerol-3-phosphate acyltransferase delta-like protein [Dinothrombium tinctorium]